MTGWVGKRGEWMGKPQPQKKLPDGATPPLPAAADINLPSVEYVPVRCPGEKCRSLNCPAYNVQLPDGRHRIRYHKCRDCGETFKSVEDIT